MSRRLSVRVAFLTLASAVYSGTAQAACTWSFNWYCSNCAKIGGRTTGNQSGYPTEAACESARRSVAPGVTTGSCSRSGICEAPSSSLPPSSRPLPVYPGSGGYQEPAYDPGAEQRRLEEERMRQEAEEAARQRAEEEKRQRQFLQDRLDALKSLKGGIDFDGGVRLKTGEELPLKSGTDTLGVKPNPGGNLGLKSALPDDPAEKESRFSKGNRFSAPVDLSKMDPAGPIKAESEAVLGLIPDGNLGAFITQQSWKPDVKAIALDGVLALERGQNQRAARLLKRASSGAPQDRFLKKAASEADKLAKERGDDLYLERYIPPGLSPDLHKAYLLGMLDFNSGNMNGAARFFGRVLDANPNDKDLQFLVQNLEKLRKPLTPEDLQRMERGRTWAKGMAAFNLGAQAAPFNKEIALNYLTEARRILRGKDYKDIDDLMEYIKAGKRVTVYEVDPHPLPGSAMLDALEYGKGNWDDSLRYLRDMKKAYPKDSNAAKAYSELERLRKESP